MFSQSARCYEIPLVDGTFCRLGAGNPRSFTKNPEAVYQGFIQDVRPQLDPSGIVPDPSLL